MPAPFFTQHLPPAAWLHDGNGITSADYADVGSVNVEGFAGQQQRVRSVAFAGGVGIEIASATVTLPSRFPATEQPMLMLTGIYEGAPGTGVVQARLDLSVLQVSADGMAVLQSRLDTFVRHTANRLTPVGIPLPNSMIRPGRVLAMQLSRVHPLPDGLAGPASDWHMIDAWLDL